MNEEEKYLFDLRGFIVLKNVLQGPQIQDLSQRLEAFREHNTNPILGSDRTTFRSEHDPAWSSASLLELGGSYLDLIDLPIVAPYLETLLGKHYRLDHDYAKIDSKIKRSYPVVTLKATHVASNLIQINDFVNEQGYFGRSQKLVAI